MSRRRVSSRRVAGHAERQAGGVAQGVPAAPAARCRPHRGRGSAVPRPGRRRSRGPGGLGRVRPPRRGPGRAAGPVSPRRRATCRRTRGRASRPTGHPGAPSRSRSREAGPTGGRRCRLAPAGRGGPAARRPGRGGWWATASTTQNGSPPGEAQAWSTGPAHRRGPPRGRWRRRTEVVAVLGLQVDVDPCRSVDDLEVDVGVAVRRREAARAPRWPAQGDTQRPPQDRGPEVRGAARRRLGDVDHCMRARPWRSGVVERLEGTGDLDPATSQSTLTTSVIGT